MKKLNKILAISGISLVSLLAGCKPKSTITMQREEVTSNTLEPRYVIKRVAVFDDSLAYQGKRGIYEIIDTETGEIYLGISGIGITEVGSHKSGKTNKEDER